MPTSLPVSPQQSQDSSPQKQKPKAKIELLYFGEKGEKEKQEETMRTQTSATKQKIHQKAVVSLVKS